MSGAPCTDGSACRSPVTLVMDTCTRPATGFFQMAVKIVLPRQLTSRGRPMLIEISFINYDPDPELFLEVSCGDDRQARRVDVALERGVDLGGGELGDALLEFDVPGEGALGEEIRAHPVDESA